MHAFIHMYMHLYMCFTPGTGFCDGLPLYKIFYIETLGFRNYEGFDFSNSTWTRALSFSFLRISASFLIFGSIQHALGKIWWWICKLAKGTSHIIYTYMSYIYDMNHKNLRHTPLHRREREEEEARDPMLAPQTSITISTNLFVCAWMIVYVRVYAYPIFSPHRREGRGSKREGRGSKREGKGSKRLLISRACSRSP